MVRSLSTSPKSSSALVNAVRATYPALSWARSRCPYELRRALPGGRVFVCPRARRGNRGRGGAADNFGGPAFAHFVPLYFTYGGDHSLWAGSRISRCLSSRVEIAEKPLRQRKPSHLRRQRLDAPKNDL